MRLVLSAALMAVAMFGAQTAALAADWPTKPLRLVIPFSPGGGTDTFGRILAAALQDELGQSVVPDNKPGAGGNIGADFVAKSPPDGYTLLLAQDSLTVVPWLYKALPFDVMKDFAPIGIGVTMPMVLVASNTLPSKSLLTLVEYAKTNPDKLSYGSPGVGTAHHLNFESFLQRTGTKMAHIPYKGAAGMNADLVSGNVQVAYTALSSALPLLETAKITAIAIASPERMPQLKNVPAMAETLPGYEAYVWFGLSAPAGTPDAIVQRISSAMIKVLQTPAVSKRLTDIGYRVKPTTPDEMTRIMQSEYSKWGQLVKTIGIKPE